MIKRYSRKELTDIWSEENKYKIWLDVEIAAAQAMEKLNQIPKGVSSIVRKKAKKNLRKSFRRFPKINELEIVKCFTPKKGTVVFFQSTPNSYHGVKRFIEKNCPKRFFIYGSYALNKPVIWNYKGISYYPHIISNKKRMLTSFHDVNYLTTAPNH